MLLRGIEFGPCLDASGLRGFFGRGYWFHHLPLIKGWYDFDESTQVIKSTKTEASPGNMPLNDDNYEPIELFPKCIWVNPFRGIALNAVGLGGPGADAVFWKGFAEGGWSADKPFMLSHAPEGDTPEDRIKDVRKFTDLLKSYLERYPDFRRVLGHQGNISCGNSNTNPDVLADEACGYLDILQELDIPVGIKFNLLAPVGAIKKTADHPACDFLCIANSIPFGQLSDRIPWKKWFPHGSPLAEFKGGGSLSGEPLLPILIERIREIRHAGIEIPINAGGGILSRRDAAMLIKYGGLKRGRDSIFIGSIAMLRPWNIASVLFISKVLETSE